MFLYAELNDGADEQVVLGRLRDGMEAVASRYGIEPVSITVGVSHAEDASRQSWAWAALVKAPDQHAGNVIDMRSWFRSRQDDGPSAA